MGLLMGTNRQLSAGKHQNPHFVPGSKEKRFSVKSPIHTELADIQRLSIGCSFSWFVKLDAGSVSGTAILQKRN